MTLIEAAKQVLGALEMNLPVIEDYGDKEQLLRQHNAITALRTAIAEAEKQEPVAWSPVLDYQNYKENRVWANGQPSQQDIDYWSKNGDGITYAYTSPPAAQQVVPKGWRMVPINPTPAMKQAGGVACTRGQDIAHHTWAQMLNAAPNPPEAQPADEKVDCPRCGHCCPQRQPLTDEEIEKGRSQTFSVDNPYCPCDSKTMRKAVRWAEAKHGITGEKK